MSEPPPPRIAREWERGQKTRRRRDREREWERKEKVYDARARSRGFETALRLTLMRLGFSLTLSCAASSLVLLSLTLYAWLQLIPVFFYNRTVPFFSFTRVCTLRVVSPVLFSCARLKREWWWVYAYDYAASTNWVGKASFEAINEVGESIGL